MTHAPPRPARALIGWMSREEGMMYLGQRVASSRFDPSLAEEFESARQAVLARPTGVDQTGVIQPQLAELDEYVSNFCASEYAKPFLAAGWQVRMVDLERLCVFQHTVAVEDAKTRTAGAKKADLQALVRLTLPLESDGEPTVQFDAGQRAWVISSKNQNLDVVGHFTRPVKGGVGCGFMVAMAPSFMQVIHYRGRYLLKDGYHRALGLLQGGIRNVPALFREIPPHETLDLGGSALPAEIWLGPRPPMLPDYLSNPASASILIPSVRRMIVVSAMGLNAMI